MTDGATTSFEIVPDESGRFRIAEWPLLEGVNAIRATATSSSGQATTAAVSVTADLTPPQLEILADGAPLSEEQNFPLGTTISVQALDDGAVTTTLRIDGNVVGGDTIVSAEGWHVASSSATDAAGNQSRLERSFHVGSRGGTAICSIDGLYPGDDSFVTGTTTGLSGRIGSAAGATVNGNPVEVVDGSFCAVVSLPAEGPNEVVIRCTDQNGEPSGDAASITLHRLTGLPAVTISSPQDEAVVSNGDGKLTVTGTVGAETQALTVNGSPVTFTGGTYSTSVQLVEGLNIIAARAVDATGRSATATARVEYRTSQPKITITSPVGTPSTGGSTIDISGTWTYLDPVAITETSSQTAASITHHSDTDGTFHITDIPLAPGENILTVAATGQASMTITVNRVAGLPSVAIDTPSDQTHVGGAVTQITVRGRYAAEPGSNLTVNGVNATLSAGSFEASVPLTTLTEVTPLVARVTEPDGQSATSIATVRRLSGPPEVNYVYPDDGMVTVDPSVLLTIGFSHAMDAASVRQAFRLERSSGIAENGDLLLARGVLMFAPDAPLIDGETYTIRIAATATDVAGQPLAKPLASTFTIATTAPAAAPTIDPLGVVCASSVVIQGSAPAGSTVVIDSDSDSKRVAVGPTGRYAQEITLSGRDGYQLVRVRIRGDDGSLSPAAELCVRTSCDRFRVVSASFDRVTNDVRLELNHSVDPASATLGDSILLTHEDGHSVGGTLSTAGTIVTITPAEDLTDATFTMQVTRDLLDIDGKALEAAYERTFNRAGDDPGAGEGQGVLSGESQSGSTGRPLPGTGVTSTTPINAYSKSEDDQ